MTLEQDGNAYEVTITFRKDVHSLTDLHGNTTLSQLRSVVEQLTDVPSVNQKLLPAKARGIADLNHPPASSQGAATSVEQDDKTLEQAGIPPKGLRIMVLGTPSKELQEVQAAEEYNWRRNGPRQYHPSMLRGTKPRNTATPGASFSPFGSIQPHHTTPPTSPLYDKLKAYLTRLATDPGILHICKLHDFRIGTLTELLPWEHPNLLGLNENAGQKISLRIRTDDAEGLRDYKTSRRVLVHELAHNKVQDHPPAFKILNSELNAQIEAYEKGQREGTHALIEGDVYVPETVEGDQADGGRRLGGQAAGTPMTPEGEGRSCWPR